MEITVVTLVEEQMSPWKGQWFWGFEVKVVGCSREQWEWRETGGLGFTGVGGKSVVQLNSIFNVELGRLDYKVGGVEGVEVAAAFKEQQEGDVASLVAKENGRVMSSSNHPTFDIEDAFSSNSPDYVLTFPDYFPASPGNTSSDSSNNLYGLVPVASPTLSNVIPIFNPQEIFVPEEISSPKDAETPVKSSIPVSLSSSVGSSSPVGSVTPPPDYPFDESIFAELDNSLWIISRPYRSGYQ
nr:hypothetical protein [Tanacetum cinerariifolium]